MARSSSSHALSINPAGIRRRVWSKEEDLRLRRCVEKYGQGHWHLVPSRAGLNRCRKSCRLRWLNYLSPHVNRGPFAPDEDDLIIKMQRLLGNRWSLIAGRIHGRTANDIKNRWNSYLHKKTVAHKPPKEAPAVHSIVVVKPQAHRPTVKPPPWFKTQQAQRAEEPEGNFTEQFCFSSWFDPMSIQGRGEEVGRGGLEAPHQAQEESLLSQILLDLDGNESQLQATPSPTQAELEWVPQILLDLDSKESHPQPTTAPTQAEHEGVPEILFDLDGKEFSLQATVAPTEYEPEWVPEILFGLDGKESSLQATAALTEAELQWVPEILLDLDGKESSLQATAALTEAELQWVPEILLGLDGKESSLQATAALTEAELQWVPEISFDFDGKEAPLQATAALTEPELEALPEILFDLDGKEFPPQATTAPTQAELEWENLLSDAEFWGSLDINAQAIFQPMGAQAPPSKLPKS